MLNKIYDGPHMVVTAGGTVASGSVQKVGTVVGIAGDSVVSGEDYALHLVGTYTVPKLAGATWSQGEKLFWDDSNGYWETVAGDAVGAYAGAAATSGATEGVVCLSGGGLI